MKNIPSLMVSFKSYSVLGTSLLESLDQYRNIANTSYPWYQYGDLEEDIFDDAFVGIQPLSGLLTDMVIVIVYIFVYCLHLCLLFTSLFTSLFIVYIFVYCLHHCLLFIDD